MGNGKYKMFMEEFSQEFDLFLDREKVDLTKRDAAYKAMFLKGSREIFCIFRKLINSIILNKIKIITIFSNIVVIILVLIVIMNKFNNVFNSAV